MVCRRIQTEEGTASGPRGMLRHSTRCSMQMPVGISMCGVESDDSTPGTCGNKLRKIWRGMCGLVSASYRALYLVQKLIRLIPRPRYYQLKDRAVRLGKILGFYTPSSLV
jgi:hypothetical protein